MTRFLFILLLLFGVSIAHAQWDMKFCTDLNDAGTCQPKGSSIKWGKDQDHVVRQLVLTNTDSIPSAKLRFMIFFMKTETQADLYADLSLYNQNPKATSVVKKVMFHKKGTFRIDVLDAATSAPLTSGTVTITD